MAFYPDELSPIEKLRSAGKPPELSDLNLMSMNRRQWKSLVLGKKDLGMNNFATIAEEKEEDISSDGSNGLNLNDGRSSSSFVNVPNKKITFPKPRKYITSRVADRKEELTPKNPEASSKLPDKEAVPDKKCNNGDDLSKMVNSPKMNLPEIRQLLKGKKPPTEENQGPRSEFVVNYAVNESPIEKQWKDATMNPCTLSGWSKQEEDKAKTRDEKKKAPQTKAPGKKTEQKKSQQDDVPKKIKVASDPKNKSLNMKDVVNVYKNLTYGTKDEIKSFIEKLSLVKDEDKVENDKNLLSMMNLKALETKIKDLEKKTGQSAGQVKKRGKTGKKPRKLHTENLARHKVVKVPATLEYSYSRESRNVSYGSVGSAEQKRKSSDEKIPWKYVGTQSILDKAYFVYPSYPQQERRKAVKKPDSDSKKAKKEGMEEMSGKAKTQSKVKQSKEILIRHNLGFKSMGSRLVNAFALSGSSNTSRSSATTVCTVEFRPGAERKSLSVGPSDQSLLLYLHGTKATYVNSPYSDKQFSRVKFFRKDGTRVPLIRGVAMGNSNRDVTIRNVRLPDRLTNDRLDDLLDFEEDIQNINEFLHSQNQSGGLPRGKREREWRRKTSPNPKTPNHPGRRRVTNDDHLTEAIVNEISRDIESLRYLPDTEENRHMIGVFFDELDQRIERSKAHQLLDKADANKSNDNNNNANNNNCLIPIVGY